MKLVNVPLQLWDSFADKLAVMVLANQKKDELLSVPTFQYQGFHYLGTAALYAPMRVNGGSYVEAYRLIPKEIYSGSTTTIWHDEDAIRAGERVRGDSVGLLVKAKGAQMVCTEKVRFEATLPTNQPMSLSEAQTHDEQYRNLGWRTFVARKVEPSWTYLNGHPVAVYLDPDKDVELYILYRKYRGEVKETFLTREMIDSKHSSDEPECEDQVEDFAQMSLF